MAKDKDFLLFSDLTRGVFVSRISVPAAGFLWAEEITLLRKGGKIEEARGPWLSEATAEDEPQLAFYRPGLYRTDLHRRFACLTTQRQILAFANKHGMLGVDCEYGWRASPDHPNEWSMTGRVYEHLVTWLHEIRQMATLLALWDLVEAGDRSGLCPYISWGREPRRVSLACGWATQGRGRLVPIKGQSLKVSREGVFDQAGQRITFTEAIIALAGTSEGDDALSYWKDGEVLGPARCYVIREVNRKQAGHVNPTVLAFGENRLYFQPDSLLAALYTLFAMEISGEQGKQRIACRQCGKGFVQRRKGQQYCSTECRSLAGYHRKRGKEKRKEV